MYSRVPIVRDGDPSEWLCIYPDANFTIRMILEAFYDITRRGQENL